MESRYALRELEGAIGIEAGNPGGGAVFRHTEFRRRALRDLRERADSIELAARTLAAYSAVASRTDTDLKSAQSSVENARRSLAAAYFPYADLGPAEERTDDYSKYFDELDRMEAERLAVESAEGGTDSGQGSPDDAPGSPDAIPEGSWRGAK